MNRVEHLLNVAYKNLNEEMQEAYPLVDLDEAIGCIAEALALLQGDSGSFDQVSEDIDREFFNRITNNLLTQMEETITMQSEEITALLKAIKEYERGE